MVAALHQLQHFNLPKEVAAAQHQLQHSQLPKEVVASEAAEEAEAAAAAAEEAEEAEDMAAAEDVAWGEDEAADVVAIVELEVVAREEVAPTPVMTMLSLLEKIKTRLGETKYREKYRVSEKCPIEMSARSWMAVINH